jgi:hypothetical protein
MALILGTTRSDVILGLLEDDTIFGDPYAEGISTASPGMAPSSRPEGAGTTSSMAGTALTMWLATPR